MILTHVALFFLHYRTMGLTSVTVRIKGLCCCMCVCQRDVCRVFCMLIVSVILYIIANCFPNTTCFKATIKKNITGVKKTIMDG